MYHKPNSRFNVSPHFAGRPAPPVYLRRPLPRPLTAAERRWRALAFPAALVGAALVGSAATALFMLTF